MSTIHGSFISPARKDLGSGPTAIGGSITDPSPGRMLAGSVLLNLMNSSSPWPVSQAPPKKRAKLATAAAVASNGQSKSGKAQPQIAIPIPQSQEYPPYQAAPTLASTSASQKSGRATSGNDKGRAYSRASKSLGLLTLSFLALSTPPKPPTLTVDGSAIKLGVERRRVYDVVNILSSLGIVRRLQKNTYENMGMGGVTQVLRNLRDEGIRSDSTRDYVGMGVVTAQELQSILASTSTPVSAETGKSLGNLLHSFLSLFLLSSPGATLSLNDASRAILGADGEQEKGGKTKVRRLYDIANVCVSLRVLEKSGSKGFRWVWNLEA
mmetsp:Transcript_7115/g.13962  ORF Transcript_7115/g.13962 Transcript_7115/m.13962 type:complete len:324 (+) Transcript_7115:187-1158(+)|eukprot:CAMPEP_0182463720 /NCGR_PEP_ID=MMETSP1319-20130603/7879_1 /TAXON_ID=172717 /ORGANISM="Bolidomonas pacifica, Strain RCC208" /LENGTH=323 /DNA_ID=CAMNT_0024663297 /DNA_START=187 /DNA_END=1158 /DNA_ORIENTATION=-